MSRYFVFFVFACIAACSGNLSPSALLDRHKAVNAYRNEEYDVAEKLFQKLLLQDHEDVETLYNLGKVAYAKKEYKQAAGYFKDVTNKAPLDDRKKQAWFDLGNAHVQQALYEEALNSYEAVLKFDAGHSQAQEMVEKLKQLLEQQKQQEQQKQEKKEQQERQQQEDKKEDQGKQFDQQQESQTNKQERNKQDRSNKDSSNNDQQQENIGGQSAQDEGSQDGENKTEDEQRKEQQDGQSGHDPDGGSHKGQEKTSQAGKNKDSKDGKQGDELGGGELENNKEGGGQQEHGADDQQADGQQESDGNSLNDSDGKQADKNTGQDKQDRSGHGAPSDSIDQPSGAKATDNVAQSDEDKQENEQEEDADVGTHSTQKESDKRLDEQQVRLLQLLEEKDAQNVKKMVKGTVKKDMPGHHGEKNW